MFTSNQLPSYCCTFSSLMCSSKHFQVLYEYYKTTKMICNKLQIIFAQICFTIILLLWRKSWVVLNTTEIQQRPKRIHFYFSTRYASLLRSEGHIYSRTQCVIMTQTKWPPTLCHMRYSQNFDKIDSFLKPVLTIFILRNLI